MEYVQVKFSNRYNYIGCTSEETKDIQKFCEKGKIINILNSFQPIIIYYRKHNYIIYMQCFMTAIIDLDLNNDDDDVCVQLCNPLGAEISPAAFPKLMDKYLSGPLGTFYFELVKKENADPIVLGMEKVWLFCCAIINAFFDLLLTRVFFRILKIIYWTMECVGFLKKHSSNQ